MLQLHLIIFCYWLVTCHGQVEVDTFVGAGATANHLMGPSGLTFSASGLRAYLVDKFTCLIWEIDVSAKTFIGSTGLNCVINAPGYIDGSCTAAKFNFPSDLAMDTSTGIIYITDTVNLAIRSMTTAPSSCVVRTVARDVSHSGTVIGGTTTSFAEPWGITIDLVNQFLYVCDRLDQTIRKIVIATNVVTTIAGSSGSPGTADGSASRATFSNPMYLVLDSANGYLYITCYGGLTIRRLDLTIHVVTTIAGSGWNGYANGIGVTGVQFQSPQGIALDPINQILYVGDGGNNVVRAVALANDAVSTFVGLLRVNGHQDGSSSVATFGFNFGGLVYNPLDSKVYICASDNEMVRTATIAAVVPSGVPSGQPSNDPSGEPTTVPSVEPTGFPSTPSGKPSGQPSNDPSSEPSNHPSGQPTGTPTGQPSKYPSGQPTSHPSGQPTRTPNAWPTDRPSSQPSLIPTGLPSAQPIGFPTGKPSRQPTGEPSSEPTEQPSGAPSVQPSGVPTVLTQNNDDDGGFSFPELGAIISIPIALILLAVVYYARNSSSSSSSSSSPSCSTNVPTCDAIDTPSEHDVELVVAVSNQEIDV